MYTDNKEKILELMLKEPNEIHTATAISNKLNLTRQGTWKILSHLEKEEIIKIIPVSKTKTSTSIIKLNYNNPITEKLLSLILTKESLKYKRWRVNFENLENKAYFTILFGSILTKLKEANDIDLITVSDKKNFKFIEEEIIKVQKTQLKKIHFIDLAKEELREELKENIAYIDAIRKGIILYGQDNFIEFIKNL